MLETGEAREVHHFCLLVGFGANAINPYLALETPEQSRISGEFSNITEIIYEKTSLRDIRKPLAKEV